MIPADEEGAGNERGRPTEQELPVVTLKSRAISVGLDDAAPSRNGGAFTPATHPQEGFLVRNRWWVLAGSIFASALALVLAWFMLFHDTSKKEAVELLVVPSGSVSGLSADVGNATSVAGFNRVARSVSRANSAVESARSAAQDLRNEEVRIQTLSLLDAESALLDAYGDLDSVTRLRSLDAGDVARKIERRADDVEEAVMRLQSLRLEEAPHPYPDRRYLRAAVRSTSNQLGE